MSNIHVPKPNGLAGWRQRQAEDKAVKMAELAVLRESATVEVREGQTFRVVKIPDRYKFGRRAA